MMCDRWAGDGIRLTWTKSDAVRFGFLSDVSENSLRRTVLLALKIRIGEAVQLMRHSGRRMVVERQNDVGKRGG